MIEHAARLVFGDLVPELAEHEGQLFVLDASVIIFIELLERDAPTLLRRIAMWRTGAQGCRVALGYREVDVCFERVPRTARWISAVPLTSEGAGSGGLCLPDENSAAATLVHPGAGVH